MEYRDFWLKNHNALRIQSIRSDVVRIRYNTSGVFETSLTERYDLIQTSFDDAKLCVETTDATITVTAGELMISLSLDDGTMSLATIGERILVREITPIAPQENRGVGGLFYIEDEERFYGGGYRPQRSINCRGQLIKNWCSYVVNNGPSPFFMSSGGWGIFWNITFENFFDIGSRQSDQMVLWSSEGELDIFLFTGTMQHMLDRYTDITGKPSLMPLYGYGISTVDGETDTENTLIDKAERFRTEGIPCDIFSLGPEWMSKRYDLSVNQDWDKSRYYIAGWMKGSQSFIGALRRYGIKTVIWTPCDYDLTHEAERQYHLKHPEDQNQPQYTSTYRHVESDTVIADENIMKTIRHDPYTVPEQAWVEHFKKYFDWGVVGIAEDGCTVQSTHIDKCYANGRTYKEMHNLNQTLNAKQYFEGYREHCGKRIMVRTPSTYIGHQKWCGTWCGDTLSGTSLLGLIKYSFQGQSNVSSDLINWDIQQMHFGFLMPWTLQFCWCYMLWPWQLEEDKKNAFRDYARLRYSLLPYIYSAAWQAHTTGLSICRAMVLMYPDDPRTYNMINQYMFGDSLLVGALTDSVYLPNGRWIDYWTGQEYEGHQDITSGYPVNRGGYLFVKKGAIIPYWPTVNYVGEKVIENLTVRFYPEGYSEYTLYEDDGESFGYEQGLYAVTRMTCDAEDQKINLIIAKREGRYEGMPGKRNYDIEIYCARPRSVSTEGWQYDEANSAVLLSIDEQEEGFSLSIVL